LPIDAGGAQYGDNATIALAESALSLQAKGMTSVLPLAACGLAAGIFIVDTVTSWDIAVPALYTAVVIMSVRFCERRGVILVALGCIALTLLSDLLTLSQGLSGAELINTSISVLAIGMTTYLMIKIESEKAASYEAKSQLTHVARVTMLGELTASIAHEVNQPLAAAVINGNASLRWLQNDPPNLEEARNAVARIVKDANRASEIITQVRSLTKSSPPKKERLNLEETVRSAIMLAERELQQAQVVFKTDIPATLYVFGDRVQLQQVILNLAMNAIEAMNGAARGPRELVATAVDTGGKQALISIADTGVGTSHELFDHLFDAFFTTKKNGMGMGLAICRSIIEAHGGSIRAMKNNPRGLVFQFTLPTRDVETEIPA
jgi:C4-dicarboxylate-specific signal transduction histidine kinase